MIKDLALAGTATLLIGTASLYIGMHAGNPGHDPFMAVGTLLAIAAGPVILWRRGTKPLIPITAIYIVVMSIVLLVVGFQIAWSAGQIDL